MNEESIIELIRQFHTATDEAQIQEISAEINQLHNTPEFAPLLLSTLNTILENGGDEYLLMQTIFAISNDIKLNWRKTNFWESEFRGQLINELFNFLTRLPTPMWDHLVCCFTPILHIGTFKNEVEINYTNIVIQSLSEILSQDEDLNQVYYLSNIVYSLVVTEYEKPESLHSLISEELDQQISTILDNLLGKSSGVVEQINGNPSNAIFLSNICKIARKYLFISIQALSTDNAANIIKFFIDVFNIIEENCEEREYLRAMILKFFSSLISMFVGNIQREIAKQPCWIAFKEVFKANFLSPIIEIVLKYLESSHSQKIMCVLDYIVYQIIFFQLVDPGIINEQFFQFLIQQCVLSEDQASDSVDNPVFFYEQQTNVEMIDTKSIPRVSCASILRTLLGKKYSIQLNEILPCFMLNETDEPLIIDSKLFILTTLCSKYLKMLRKINKDQEIDMNEHIPFDDEFIDTIQNSLVTQIDQYPYLAIDALHLLQKIIPLKSPIDSRDYSIGIIDSDYVENYPLVALFAAKIFNSSAKAVEYNEEFFSSLEIEDEKIYLLIETIKLFNMRPINKMLSLLIENCPDIMQTSVQAFLSMLISIEEPEQITYEELTQLLTTINSYLIPFEKNIQPEYFDAIYEFLNISFESIQVDENTNTALYPFEEFFDLLSTYSINLSQHPENLYLLCKQIIIKCQQCQSILNCINTQSLDNFILTIYPLILSNEIDDEFQEASKFILYQLLQLHQDDLDGSGNILLGMAAYIQKYFEDSDTTIQFIQFAFTILHQISQSDNQDEQSTNIQGCIIFLATLAQFDPTIGNISQNEEFINLLHFFINKNFLPSFTILKLGVYILLTLSRQGNQQCFEHAVSLLPTLNKLNDDDENEEEEEEEEENEEEDNDELYFGYDLPVEDEKISPLFIEIANQNPEFISEIGDQELQQVLADNLSNWSQDPDTQI